MDGDKQDIAGSPYDAELRDVIDVINENDPDFAESTQTLEHPRPSSMLYNGGGQVPAPPRTGASTRHEAFIKIIEQPAQKALRFRYECEGRSAGSIPGESSSQENKTYPEIKVEGYTGRAVAVVSCVVKDAPYAVHPHKLVGKGCNKGVCTVEIPPGTMTVQFQNLGIQCVKKREIEQSLQLREDIRVDPFRQHYHHRNQPTSIDLNAVRLCFQVFIQGDTPGKFTQSLQPVVSNIIYDKKAMSDLTIIKLSDCVSYVDGGRKDIILLCEKVAKEDIEIHFFEQKDGRREWEAKADFQPSQVHKQHAIWFRTPRYRTIEVTEPVKVFIQLYRPSDGVRSEPLPFELLPLSSGRTPYWSIHHGLSNKTLNYNIFNSILANDIKLSGKRHLNDCAELKSVETNNNETTEPNYADVKKNKLNDDVILVGSPENTANTDVPMLDTSNDADDQVAELDVIYSDTKAKLLTESLKLKQRPAYGLSQDESFDDAITYSSLQLAFKNPVPLEVNKEYEDVNADAPLSSKIGAVSTSLPPKPPPKAINHSKHDDSTVPPLPPKRTKKIETYIGGSMSSIQLTGEQADKLLTRSGSMRSTPVSRTSSFNLQRPKSQGELSPPSKNLPPVPNSSSTLPNPKKRGIFSRIFRRKGSKANTPAPSREPSVTPSLQSTKSLQVDQNLSKSSGNISTHSSNSVRIRLKDDSPPQTPGSATALTIPPVVTATPNFDENMDQFDLTDAENYALYMTLAPQATQSEFDEISSYYSHVEDGKVLTLAEVMARQKT